MGTDIGGQIEARRGDTEPWHVAIDKHTMTRSSLMFAVMAGVKDGFGVVPIAPDRGLPDDSPEPTRRLCDDCGCFGATWLTTAEVGEALAVVEALAKTSPFGGAPDDYVELHAEMLRLEQDGWQVRFVCWFDN